MSDVFISYAHEDRASAKLLAQILQAKGWSVWWDRNIVAGQSFDQIIEHELDTAKAVVALWSRHSVASEWVKNEAAAAAERGVLVPAMIHRIKLPLEFRRRQTADLAGWSGDPDHDGFQSLCDGLTAVMTGEMPPKTQGAKPPFHPKSWWRQGRWWITAGILALALAGGAFWLVGNNSPRPHFVKPSGVTPDTRPEGGASYRKDIYDRLNRAQHEALDVMRRDKAGAIALIDRNLTDIDKALQSFPNDPGFLVLKGYAAKNVYMSSKNLLDSDRRAHYLGTARKSFTKVLEMDNNNAAAHNGMGNVLFFEGRFDEAIEEHDIALRLTNGSYAAAEHDKKLVERVKSGEVSFNY